MERSPSVLAETLDFSVIYKAMGIALRDAEEILHAEFLSRSEAHNSNRLTKEGTLEARYQIYYLAHVIAQSSHVVPSLLSDHYAKRIEEDSHAIYYSNGEAKKPLSDLFMYLTNKYEYANSSSAVYDVVLLAMSTLDMLQHTVVELNKHLILTIIRRVDIYDVIMYNKKSGISSMRTLVAYSIDDIQNKLHNAIVMTMGEVG